MTVLFCILSYIFGALCGVLVMGLAAASKRDDKED